MTPETIRALVASRHSATSIAKQFGVSKKAILGYVAKHDLGPWLSRNGFEARAIPDDFSAIAPTIPRDTAQKRWKCGAGTLARWYREASVIPSNQRRNRAELSAEEVALVTGMGIMEAARALGINRDTASKMMRRAGLVRDTPPAEKKAKVRAVKFAKPIGTWKPTPVDYVRDMSTVGQAVDELRKLGPIYRKGDKWLRGNTLLTDEEIMERAMARGWKPVH